MQTNMKRITLIIIAILIPLYTVVVLGYLCGQVKRPEPVVLGATLEQKIANLDSFIQAQQGDYLTANGKYQQVLKKIDSSTGIQYEIHEYITSKGEKGYQLFIYKEDGSMISKGFGVEALSRTYTIPAPIINTTPTSTPK